MVGPGTLVTLSGSNIRSSLTLALAGTTKRPIEVTVVSDSVAPFVAPADLPPGPLKLVASQDGVEQPVSIFFESGKSDFPIITADPSLISSGLKFYDAAGVLTEGTMKAGNPLCTEDGQIGIKSGVSIGGVVGALTSGSSYCSRDGETGCVTSASFKAAKLAHFAASDIKAGVSIAGVVGTFAVACSIDGQ